MPKSVTFSRPSRPTTMLCGLMSRWTIPCRCANASALQDLRARSRSRSGSASGPLRTSELLERAPVEELHRDVVGALGLAAVEDRDDVRVVQAGGVLRLAPEALDELLVARVPVVRAASARRGGRAPGPRRGRRRPSRPSRACARSGSGGRRCRLSRGSVVVAIGARLRAVRRRGKDRLHELLRDRRRDRCRRSRSAWLLDDDGAGDDGVVGRGEEDEPGVVDARRAGLGGAGLAGDDDARDLRAACRCRSATASTIMSRIAAAVFGFVAVRVARCGCSLVTIVAVRRDDLLDELRLSSPCRRSRSPAATIAICSGVTQHALLAEREAARVDLRRPGPSGRRACASSGRRAPRPSRASDGVSSGGIE